MKNPPVEIVHLGTLNDGREVYEPKPGYHPVHKINEAVKDFMAKRKGNYIVTKEGKE